MRHIQVIDGIGLTGASMSDIQRIPTHIEGLDENMQGGIPQGHICLVAGASGAMKSSLTFSMLYNACLLYTSPSPRDLSTTRMPSSA